MLSVAAIRLCNFKCFPSFLHCNACKALETCLRSKCLELSQHKHSSHACKHLQYMRNLTYQARKHCAQLDTVAHSSAPSSTLGHIQVDLCRYLLPALAGSSRRHMPCTADCAALVVLCGLCCTDGIECAIRCALSGANCADGPVKLIVLVGVACRGM